MEQEDLLDVPSSAFDPIKFVNERFPDETSLLEVESYALKLETEITQLDDKLALAVRAQSQLAGKALDDLEKAKTAVGELHAKVRGIRSKAEDSEKRVKAVCSDITRLDRAKTNLQSTMKALTMASRLLTAVDQLEFLSESRRYTDAATILVAVNELNDYFNSHDSVPKIREMRNSVARVKDSLTKNVFEDVQSGLGAISDLVYDGGGDGIFYPSDSQTPEELRGACAVADLLSAHTRKTLRKTLISVYLRPYEVLFKSSLEDFGDRRFAWISRLLEANQQLLEYIFPPSWKMEQLIIYNFCQITAQHFQQALDSGTIQVPIMVKTLKKTVEFEQKMTERYAPNRRRGSSTITTSEQDPNAQEGGAVPTEENGSSKQTDVIVDEAVAEIPTNWRGVISSVFQPFMGTFVRVLADSVREQMESAMVEELVESTNGQQQVMMRVYPSSTALFQAIKQTMNTMIDYSNSQPFLDLCLAFKVRLTSYADALERRATNTSGGGFGAPSSSGSGIYPPGIVDKPLNPISVRLLCIGVNTADYMAEEIPSLQKTVLKKIDPNLQEKIDFNSERERFYDAVSRAVNALATRLVSSRLEPILDQISKQNWLTMKDSGDQSLYVRELQSTLHEIIPVIGSTMANVVYFRSFCDNFATAFLRAFQITILKLKRVGEDGARQLFVDCSAIESALLEVPTLGSGKSAKPTSSIAISTYTKFVENGMRRHKMLFKVLSVQVKMSVAVEDFSRSLGPSASIVLFEQMLDLRGIVKPEDRKREIKQAEEAGIPKTVPEDELVKMLSAEITKEAPPAPIVASASTRFFGGFEKLAAATTSTQKSVPPPPPPPPPSSETKASVERFGFNFGVGTKRPNPSPPPPPPPGKN